MNCSTFKGRIFGENRNSCMQILTFCCNIFSKSISFFAIRGTSAGHWLAPNHYLNQCWNIVNWTLRNKLQWKFNWNTNIFIHENTIESVVCEMAAILSRPQCVKSLTLQLPGCLCNINQTFSNMYFFHLSSYMISIKQHDPSLLADHILNGYLCMGLLGAVNENLLLACWFLGFSFPIISYDGDEFLEDFPTFVYVEINDFPLF